ncbi:MAG: hypothetical protein ACP5GJ_02825 [Nanopusillaceae archaeon]
MVGIFDLAKAFSGASWFKEIPKENIDYSKELIESSKKDLDNSKSEYSKGNYNMAIYYLDQSLFSSVKSLSILFSLLKLKDIKDKKYNSFEEFINKNKMFSKMKKLIEQNSKFFELLLNEENKRQFKKDFDEYKKKIDEFLDKIKDKNERKNIVRYSEEELNRLFELNENINKYQMSEEVLESYVNLAMNLFSKLGGQYKSMVNTGLFKSLIKKELGKNKDNLNIFGNILILSGILMLHERSSREYDNELDFSPSNYNKDLGIVKIYNKIYNMVDGLIKFEENFLQVLENKDKMNLS